MDDALALARRLCIAVGEPESEAEIAATLARFGAPALRFARKHRIAVRPLSAGERFDTASAALVRLRIDVDAWPAPPAGLFVVEERCVYLRSRSPMTVAHEFGHALDCALGGGVYRSGIAPAVRDAFARATRFVTPYAATGLDEYFAEGLRAYVEINDAGSPWPRATRARLASIDPGLHAYISALFSGGFENEAA
ncbi:MAG: hypothetical protein PXZ07_10395 [Candidatus Eremiobacteraeota bacterium]|nr:hypothetical protein [Candidatus Eremiobacteraeota bacterium]